MRQRACHPGSVKEPCASPAGKAIVLSKEEMAEAAIAFRTPEQSLRQLRMPAERNRLVPDQKFSSRVSGADAQFVQELHPVGQ